jgi:CRISPR-associated endonuclease/helicase Cas3
MPFNLFFCKATDHDPFPYQTRLAQSPSLPEVLSIPTGLGKTAAVVLAWLWRRYAAGEDIRASTPRRLVYCLPTRVLVKQTVTAVQMWLDRLSLPIEPSGRPIRAFPLMGGEDLSIPGSDSWEMNPLDSAIIIGTQDMLLSRALNRGYAMSRFSWPIPFALLNNDVLWVMDETQLMGPGLATSAQMAGLRRKLMTSQPAHSVWMSATMEERGLDTVDNTGARNAHSLMEDDLALPAVAARVNAPKACRMAAAPDGSPITQGSPTYEKDLAALAVRAHRPGTLTLIVMNTVGRCQEVFRRLDHAGCPVMLIHSGFRKQERETLEAGLAEPPGEAGRILVSTQVVEAGVDISSATLITEPAPWPSLVQRIGRCNRYGEFGKGEATIIWTSPSEKDADHLPYEREDVLEGIGRLSELEDASPSSLRAIGCEGAQKPVQVLRRKDLLELFDTSPDLLGFDMDIGRFIRDSDDSDVLLFWRDIDGGHPREDMPEAHSSELCRVSLKSFAAFLAKSEKPAFYWDHLTGRWVHALRYRLLPGRAYLLDASAGGYSGKLGWTGNPKEKTIPLTVSGLPADYQTADPLVKAVKDPVTLDVHSSDVADEIAGMAPILGDEVLPLLRRAALLHDVGKAHEVFREAVGGDSGQILAKSPAFRPYSRKGFRHELASALAALQNGEPHLLCYLVAAHHGKVRMSLRSHEFEPQRSETTVRRARGIIDGDILQELTLPEGITLPRTVLDLSPMDLGGSDALPSWRQMTQSLLDENGPFRLAWMEALLRIADWRASAREAGDA